MSWVGAAVTLVSAAATIYAADQARQAGEDQAEAIKTSAEAELAAYKKAQELLEKNKDEAISDIELAQLQTMGLSDEMAAKFQKKIDDIDTNIAKAREGIKSNNKQIAEWEKKIIPLERRLAVIETNIDAEENENEKYDILAQISDLESKIDSAKTANTDLEADIQSKEDSKQPILKKLSSEKTGLLDEAEIAYIDAINKSEAGAIATLDEWYNSVGEIYASREELVLRDLIQYGIVEPKKHINKSTEKAIAQITGDSEKAANLLKPYQEAGRRGLERQQFLTGMLTEEERTKHLDKYGAIEGTPIYEFRLGEGQKALERRQKMSGNIFSGKALEQELDLTNQLTAEETQRQLNEARGLSAQGFAADSNVAGILQNRAQQIAGLESQRGINLAQVDQQGARGLAAARTGFADAQAANTRGYYQNKYNLGLSLNEARAQMRKNTLLNKAQILREDAQNKANIKIGVGGQVAGLMTQGASNYAQNLINASTAANQGALASSGLIMQGIGQGLNAYNNNQFMNMMNQNYMGSGGVV